MRIETSFLVAQRGKEPIVSKWAGKYVIGLTGNIGTGKSVVRRMLEHMGAYGIDADALAHRAMAKGAPGYAPVVTMFGRWILAEDGQIDRARLGKVVFSDPLALVELEKIIHPLVSQAIDIMVKRAGQGVVVVEAIKLLEAGLAKDCDSIWVTSVPADVQINRLVKSRGMIEADARRRIQAQPAPQEKIARATVVINNGGSFESTWKQVQAAWRQLVPSGSEKPEAPAQKLTIPLGEISIIRGRPKHSADIAALINRLGHKDEAEKNSDDIMAAFGEKAFLLLQTGKGLSGLVGWQVENLVARTTDILLDPSLPVEQALPPLIAEMEQASRSLQCEASLIFVEDRLSKLPALWKSLGYEQREPKSLGIQAWQEAARESMPAGTVLYFKQLRQDRVLRPI